MYECDQNSPPVRRDDFFFLNSDHWLSLTVFSIVRTLFILKTYALVQQLGIAVSLFFAFRYLAAKINMQWIVTFW